MTALWLVSWKCRTRNIKMRCVKMRVPLENKARVCFPCAFLIITSNYQITGIAIHY